MSRVIMFTAILGLLIGCERPASSSTDSDTETKDPKALAEKMDQFAAQELAKAKIPGRAWLMDEKHGTFTAKKADVLKIVDDCVAAGATGVWVGEAGTMEDKQLIDHLFIELPADATKRTKIFEVYNKDGEGLIDEPEKDLGQKYLVVDWG